MNSIRRKFDLYILSLGLLFIFFIVITIKLPSIYLFQTSLIFWRDLAINNFLPIFFILALMYCIYAYLRFDYDLKGATEIPFEITNLKDINYEHLTFLATYVVPLVSFDFSGWRQIIVLFMLLIVIGFIYIKTDLFYANPSLALLGFHIYQANGNFKFGDQKGLILICRGRLREGQLASYIKLDKRIYYVKGK